MNEPAKQNLTPALIEHYKQNPVAFLRDVYGMEADPWQAELIQLMRAKNEGRRRLIVGIGRRWGR